MAGTGWRKPSPVTWSCPLSMSLLSCATSASFCHRRCHKVIHNILELSIHIRNAFSTIYKALTPPLARVRVTRPRLRAFSVRPLLVASIHTHHLCRTQTYKHICSLSWGRRAVLFEILRPYVSRHWHQKKQVKVSLVHHALEAFLGDDDRPCHHFTAAQRAMHAMAYRLYHWQLNFLQPS